VNEIVALNKQERDRLIVLRQVKERRMTQKVAAGQLGLSTRWVKKLVKRMRQQGDRGLAHRLRGKPSNRGHGAKLRRRALALVRERYADYGPTLASEVLAQEHGLEVNRETLRQWMSQEKLWRPRRAKLKQVHVWRPRRKHRGELVQWDTSEHDWLEGRGRQKLYLIAMIDDASSELTAQFALSDSTAENMRLLGRYVEQHGRPGAVYTDKASLFQVNRPLHYNKHLEEAPEATQIARALQDLGIGRITAHSPQAKGRVERCFGTLQDRLVKALRRAGVGSLEQANRYLEQEFVPGWNRRFRRRPAEQADAHRPLRTDQKLVSILSHVERRSVANDYTIAWRGKRYQIPAPQAQARMRKAAVAVQQRLDGELWLRWRQQEIQLHECSDASRPAIEAQPVAKPARTKANPKPKTSPRWMDGFWAGDPAKQRRRLPATPVALRAHSVAGNGT
jgi:Homeodomain-like domain